MMNTAVTPASWLRQRGLTLVLLVCFAGFTAAQFVSGWLDYNETQRQHGVEAVAFSAYLTTGHPWEALFENWESEFLQMAAFVVLTTMLVQKGSPESRRDGVTEPFDADPRRCREAPDAPWPVRRGGLVLRLYEYSLSLAFVGLFFVSWLGHVAGGFAEARAEALAHGQGVLAFSDYIRSPRLWFESFQNWQSEFLAIAAMVWLSVYLRQRWSPESKPVHAPHDEHD